MARGVIFLTSPGNRTGQNLYQLETKLVKKSLNVTSDRPFSGSFRLLYGSFDTSLLAHSGFGLIQQGAHSGILRGFSMGNRDRLGLSLLYRSGGFLSDRLSRLAGSFLSIIPIGQLLPDSKKLLCAFSTHSIVHLGHDVRAEERQMVVPVEIRTEHDNTGNRHSGVKNNLSKEHTGRNLNTPCGILLAQVTQTRPLIHILLGQTVPVQGHGSHVQNVRMVTVKDALSVKVTQKNKGETLANLESPPELAAAHNLLPVFFRQSIRENSEIIINIPDKVGSFRLLTGGIITLIPHSIVALGGANKNTSQLVGRNHGRGAAVKQFEIRLADTNPALSGPAHSGKGILIRGGKSFGDFFRKLSKTSRSDKHRIHRHGKIGHSISPYSF
nr:MAG TPA: hypothetical protein [Caudoviricetes sp.]